MNSEFVRGPIDEVVGGTKVTAEHDATVDSRNLLYLRRADGKEVNQEIASRNWVRLHEIRVLADGDCCASETMLARKP